MSSNRTWFITGTSRGFGREWASAALARGDRVVGTARDPSTLDDLAAGHPDTFLRLALDVTDRARVFETVKQAQEHFGELDIVVNNAGYGHFGMIEEATEEEARAQFEANVFGALWVTQAALPYMREQGHGHFLQVSSLSGVVANPNVGLYHASKWALEAFSQSVAREVAQFGVHVTIVEPGAFATDWAGASARRSKPIAVYDDLRQAGRQRAAGMKRGDPKASAEALLKVVDTERPPLRVFFGTGLLETVETEYRSRLDTWREWEPVAELAQG